MVLVPIKCLHCRSLDVIRHGQTSNEKRRFLCQNEGGDKTFIHEYSDKGCLPEIKRRIIDMAVNDVEFVIRRGYFRSVPTQPLVSKKKEPELQAVNYAFLANHPPDQITAEVIKVEENQELDSDHPEAEMDEMRSYVDRKGNQRWLWHAFDRETRKVLAYVFGERKDRVFLDLKSLLAPFGIKRFYTDDWGAYERNLAPEQQIISKQNIRR